MTTTQNVQKPRPGRSTRSPRIAFARHYLEMVAAMFIAMGVLAMARDLVGLNVEADQHLEWAYLLMALDMSVGMALIMRWRRHSWSDTLVMCAVMFVPALLFPLVWVGALSVNGFIVIAHIAMFPLMALVMVWQHGRG